MSAADNIAIVRRFFEEFCNGRRLELAEVLVTPDHRYIDPQVPQAGTGPQAIADVIAIYQTSVDGHWQINDIFAAEGDRVVVLWTGSGTHRAEVMGIPPTGKPVRVSAISVLTIRDGKIAEHRCNWDTLGFLQQLGVIPAPGQAVG